MRMILGIDLGTSGIRTAVLDTSGKLVSMAQQPLMPQDTSDINAELWWESVRRCIKTQIKTLNELGMNPHDISAISVDGTSGTMLLTDANLQPVTRALMYDSKEFAHQAEEIGRVAPVFHITRGSNSALARALHLMREDTDNRARHLLHQADFITAKLTGIGGYSDYNNSLKTGFDPETESWPEWISDIGIDLTLFPKVRAPGTPIAKISKFVADQLGLPGNVTVYAGTTDSIAAFLACAEPEPGVAVTSLGSTLVVKVMSEKRIDDPEIGLYSHRLGDGWLTGGASNTGGGLLAKYFTPDEIQKYCQRINPKFSSGLDYYPLTKPGERFPVNDPTLQPRMSPRPQRNSDFLHGLLEGMANIEARCYQAIQQRGGAFPHTIFTAGGGSTNQTWKQIREVTLGQKIFNANHTEAAVGSARLVLMMGKDFD